jgi:hypothetical protein
MFFEVHFSFFDFFSKLLGDEWDHCKREGRFRD